MAALWRAGRTGEPISPRALVAAADWAAAGLVPPPTGEAAADAIEVLVELGLAVREGDELRLSAPANKSDPATSTTYQRLEARRRDALERIAGAAARRATQPVAGTM
jgi:hypothetical protein